jgi:hypothetical protein
MKGPVNKLCIIAANLKYREQLRLTWRRTLYIIIGVAVISAIVVSSFEAWHSFPRQVVYELIISLCVGSTFWLSLPVIRTYAERVGARLRWAFRIVSWAIIWNIGMLIGSRL